MAVLCSFLGRREKSSQSINKEVAAIYGPRSPRDEAEYAVGEIDKMVQFFSFLWHDLDPTIGVLRLIGRLF